MNKQDIMNMKPGNEMDMIVGKKVVGDITGEKAGYSTEISSAWLVIQKMMDRNYQYNISYSENKHTCVLDNLFTHRRFIIHSSTPTEAICKAALLAILEEEREQQSRLQSSL